MLLYNYFSSLQSKYHGVRQNWLDQYQSTVKASTENTKAKQALLYKSLGISRELANRPAIAATLTQSADIDAVTENFSNAEDKYLRALFIRHQLGDVKNTLLILQQLQTVYNSTENDRKKTNGLLY